MDRKVEFGLPDLEVGDKSVCSTRGVGSKNTRCFNKERMRLAKCSTRCQTTSDMKSDKMLRTEFLYTGGGVCVCMQ